MKSSILKHPVTILGGVAIGVLVGFFNAPLSAFLGIENFAQIISFPGQLYLLLLQMMVIPIVITAIVSNLGELVRNKSSLGFIKKLVVVFVICMAVCALLGVAAGIFGKAGSELSEDTRSLLSKLISSSDSEGISEVLEINLDENNGAVADAHPGIGNFFISLIPSNIFQALSFNSIMAIVFFSIITGIAIGFLPDEFAALLIDLFSAVFQAFQKMIGWYLYLLPFGLICLLAGQITAVGVEIFTAMSKFIVISCIGTVVIFIICTLIMWSRSGIRNPVKVLSALFEPILLAFATRNYMATMPSAINCLEKDMKFNSTSVNLTLPLGITFGCFGSIFYFAFGVFFVAQIYNIPLELIPLSLPMEAALVVFMAIYPLIDPFRTFLTVLVNMTAATLVAERQNKNEEEEPAAGSLREAVPQVSSFNPADYSNENLLLVYIREVKNMPPLLKRDGGIVEGYEISYIKEIGKRLNRNVILKDGAAMNPRERNLMKQKADIIAGIVTDASVSALPEGFSLSQTWAAINVNGVKKPVYFLLHEKDQNAGINSVIKALSAENFLKTIARAAGNN